MAAPPRRPIALRLTPGHRDILDALVYIEGKRTGRTMSPNDVLGKVVADYLDQHAEDPGVQASIRAAQEAMQTEPTGPRRIDRSTTEVADAVSEVFPSDAA